MKLYLKMLIHAIYWLVFGLLSLTVSLTKRADALPMISDITPHYIINFIWAIIAFYLFYLYFIRYFERKEFTRYLLYSIIVSLAITALFLPSHKLIVGSFNMFKVRIFGPPLVGTFIIAQCGSLVRGFENWFANIQLRAELENRNLKNELELLKSQVNPHFLFNTLNNIDALIHTVPANASASLITLSDMLRYMIYETNTNSVPLTKEITYLKNFISLQQLRFRNPNYIKASFPEQCQGVSVAPMLFLPFLENAFKYAVNTGHYPVIDISVTCHDNSVVFICQNYYGQEKEVERKLGGVGLTNVKRRLELLYKERHTLDIRQENAIFRVELSLFLK
jgi:two-component system, LytTR family, sensor kinase